MPVSFKKRLIDKVPYEAASAFDVNNDGIIDIVCGEYWYEGPTFEKKHKICDVSTFDEYYDDFSDIPMDVNGDGLIDIVTGGWGGGTLRWRENPGNNGVWKVHDIDQCGPIETTRFFDIDNCGVPEIFPNTPCGGQFMYKLAKDENGKGMGCFKKYTLFNGFPDHGMGFADINGDGRIDIVLRKGWLEQPEDLFNQEWIFHEEFDLGNSSVPILAYDVTGNGLCDLIVGSAHAFGLFWFEQVKDENGSRTWIKHEIDTEGAQYHDMCLADIDNDGELELITGKRYRAHCGREAGDNDDPFVYYFKINGGRFDKYVIDKGSPEDSSGVGIYFWVEDVTGNGFKDIIAPGKEGLYLFENLGNI